MSASWVRDLHRPYRRHALEGRGAGGPSGLACGPDGPQRMAPPAPRP